MTDPAPAATTRRRTLLSILLATTGVVALAGCAPSADSERALAVETAFFEALAAGDGDAALALTDLDRDDISCPDLFTDYGDIAGGIGGAEIGEVRIDGDGASVDFEYASNGATMVTGTHDLVRDGDGWLIVFPEEYYISGSVTKEVVAELSFDAAPDTAGTCAASYSGGTFGFEALPGSYELDVRDPTGVFDSDSFTSAAVVVSDAAEATVDVDYLAADHGARERASIEIGNALIPLIESCAESNFAGTSCPEGLPVADGAVTVAPFFGARFTDFPDVTRIYSENGQTWRFEAGGEDFLFMRDGVAETFPMAYSGVVSAAADGSLQVALD